YGHVVDTFIPTKRSKAGKRFGFVRFINVFNEERLVNNLCTIWIDRLKLHANIARFHRTPLYEKYSAPKNAVVKGQSQPDIRDSESIPAVVLDDECLMSKDLSKSLFGRVKEFASLANLKMALSNEGFVDIKIQYMGELWVLMEFVSENSIKLFRDNVSVGSLFSQIKQVSMDFTIDGRIVWVEVEEEMCFHSKRLCIHTKIVGNIAEEFKIIFRGKVSWIRAKETPGWVPDFLDESDDEEQNEDESTDDGSRVHETGRCGDDSDAEGILEIVFEETGKKENNMDEEPTDQHDKMSEDPFNIYTLLKKKKDTVENDNNSEYSVKYPPGFTPNSNDVNVEDSRGKNFENLSDCNVDEVNNAGSGKCSTKNSKDNVSDSVCSGHFKKSEVPRTGGSILNLLDEVVKVGQVMGYKMDGCMSNITEIIESQGAEGVY
ncbi:hypothetical protein Tco_1280787, partial [Tanacetum coccineum]